jgi:hypothetical protein
VSDDGRIVRSYGEPGESPAGELPRRAVGASAGGRVWIAHRDRYRVERWNTAGRLVDVLERVVAWFPVSAATRGTDASIRQIREDADGRLWVHVVVRDQTSATIIEVLDPAAGTVITSATFQGWAGDPVGGGFYLRTYRELPTGEPRIDVWGFRLRQ